MHAIVASDLPVLDVMNTYCLRCGIDSACNSLTSRELHAEVFHMTAQERLSRSFGLLCSALPGRHGSVRSEQKPTPLGETTTGEHS